MALLNGARNCVYLTNNNNALFSAVNWYAVNVQLRSGNYCYFIVKRYNNNITSLQMLGIVPIYLDDDDNIKYRGLLLHIDKKKHRLLFDDRLSLTVTEQK